MFKPVSAAAAAVSLSLNLMAGSAAHAAPPPKAEIGDLQVSPGLTLRRMVYAPSHPKGTVLFLHGFPETMLAWRGIAETLAADYEVHAFDWPGYGQSSRPDIGSFSYAPRDYARVLRSYIQAAGIGRGKLLIYATDIGALPALLAALEQPDLAAQIIVGDFAPFNRPQYMYASLQALKSPSTAAVAHAAINKNRDEILANAYRRGLAREEQFDVAPEYQADMAKGWGSGAMTAADAFFHYYAAFTRDQDYFEAHLADLKTPVRVVWGERDFYISKEMGMELAARGKLPLSLLPGLGHYPHLQAPQQTVDEVRQAFATLAAPGAG